MQDHEVVNHELLNEGGAIGVVVFGTRLLTAL
jgi:hypothetical protein